MGSAASARQELTLSPMRLVITASLWRSVEPSGVASHTWTVFATQSTISKAVKQLEDELGLPLLDRIGHRSQLTAAGEIVYRRALTMLTEREDRRQDACPDV